jgi:EAL domain-containing protein (putative c-di-GMP-specific phosphodiesterase class I)
LTNNEPKGRILLVDDDAALLEVFVDLLREAGYAVEAASSGARARELIAASSFDLVLTDIVMPDTNGIEVLRAVRERDLDVPVILVTGSPTMETAIQAVEMGALRYLVKPMAGSVLLEAVERALRLKRLAEIKREVLVHLGQTGKLVGDRAGLEAVFDRGFQALWVAYQPIVRVSDGGLFGYEALLRTREPAISNPMVFIGMAERLDRTVELWHAIRAEVVRGIPLEPSTCNFSINIDPLELSDHQLYSEDGPLAPYARQIILEITERASLEGAHDLRARIRDLRRLGFRIAIDDLGAGYAGLGSFATLEPELVKIDRALVENLDHEPVKRRLVGSILSLCRELGVLVVAEGVETVAEKKALVDFGCDLLQGFLIGRPAPLPGSSP